MSFIKILGLPEFVSSLSFDKRKHLHSKMLFKVCKKIKLYYGFRLIKPYLSLKTQFQS